MTVGEVKAFLRSIRLNQMRVMSDFDHLDELRSRAESAQAMQYGREKVSGGDTGSSALERVVLAIVACEEKIEADNARYQKAIDDVLNVIQQVQDANQVAVLKLRYHDYKQWERICTDLNYSWKQIHRIHADALLSVKQILEAREQDDTQ